MVKIKRLDGWHRAGDLPPDPDFIFTPHVQPGRKRPPRIPKIYPVFPPIIPHQHNGYSYRLAGMGDLDDIVHFVDLLLAGHDFFCPRGQHISYFKYKTIVVTFDDTRLIGWAVRQKAGSLIHLLVDPDYRGKGIGSHLLNVLEPLTIRSKSDQSTGDPFPFYEKHGYIKTSDERIGKNKNIDLLSKRIPVEKANKVSPASDVAPK
jgi:GNAT superfamily N-acetyltransferase